MLREEWGCGTVRLLEESWKECHAVKELVNRFCVCHKHAEKYQVPIVNASQGRFCSGGLRCLNLSFVPYFDLCADTLHPTKSKKG